MSEEEHWHDDGHVLHVILDSFSGPKLRAECADREACEAKFGCVACDGGGRRYGQDDEETDCPECNGTGTDAKATAERCCLVEWMEESGTTGECMEQGPDVEVTTCPVPILWRAEGSMEDWDPYWKVKADAPVG